jgi:hypothetical protein
MFRPDTGAGARRKRLGSLFGMLADRIEALFADKSYDADAIRQELTKADVEAVIPTKVTAAFRSRMIARNTVGAVSSSACLASLKIGAVSQHVITRPQSPISASWCSRQLRCGYPLSAWPSNRCILGIGLIYIQNATVRSAASTPPFERATMVARHERSVD